jgi:hypothetical protein
MCYLHGLEIIMNTNQPKLDFRSLSIVMSYGFEIRITYIEQTLRRLPETIDQLIFPITRLPTTSSQKSI